jgi:hypothetical protein
MHYVVVGRKHGDDEATAGLRCSRSETAELLAIEEMGSNAEDAERFDLLVYIDAVFSSQTAISMETT